MIICIVENSDIWTEFGVPYAIDTHKLNESDLRNYLESFDEVELFIDNTHSLTPIPELYHYGFSDKYSVDIQQAMVNLPIKVDKFISIIFK